MSPAIRWWRRKTHPNRLTDPPHPVATWAYAATAVGGYLVLFGALPTSIQRTLPQGAWQAAWAVLLAAGGTAALIGQFWRGDKFAAADVKRAGLLFLAGGCGSYAYALAGVQGFGPAVLPICQNTGLAVSCALRAVQITVILQRAHRLAVARETEANGGC